MAEIFVSYASEDRDRIRSLIAVLEDEGWSTWWDRELVAGPRFDEKIEEALDAARCVVVAWSEHSIKSHWCRAEASEGLERQILVPLLLDAVRPPLPFRSSHTASLNGWPQERGELYLLLRGIRQCLGTRAPTIAPIVPETKSLAVLPFVNLSSDPDQEYFADGITEDLIDRLSGDSGLRVIARTSSFQFKGRPDDVRHIGSRLGVSHVVEGSVRRSGSRIRVNAQLVRADDGSQMWSARYDRELGDVFALQDEITNEITRQLTQRLATPHLVYRPSPEAYDQYLKGQVWLRRAGFREGKNARSFFDAAIEADPHYAEAYAAAAKASLMEGSYSLDFMIEPHDRAIEYIDKALAIDGKLPSALLQKAKILAQWDFRVQEAIDLVNSVLEREPELYEALAAAIAVYAYAGRQDLVEGMARRILRIDPVGNVGLGNLFWALLGQGRLVEARDAGEALLAIEPENLMARLNMATLLSRQGLIDEALAYIERHNLREIPLSCFIYAAAKRQEDVERLIEGMSIRSGLKVVLAHCYALLGNHVAALQCLKQGIEQHDAALPHLIGCGPYDECVTVNGEMLGEFYGGSEVQRVLGEINLDRDSVRRLRI